MNLVSSLGGMVGTSFVVYALYLACCYVTVGLKFVAVIVITTDDVLSEKLILFHLPEFCNHFIFGHYIN